MATKTIDYSTMKFTGSWDPSSSLNVVNHGIPTINHNLYTRTYTNYATPSTITITKNSSIDGSYATSNTSEGIYKDEDGYQYEMIDADYLIVIIKTRYNGDTYSLTINNIGSGVTTISGTLTVISEYYSLASSTIIYRTIYNGTNIGDTYQYFT